MEKCLILSARRYSFVDDQGKQVEGVKATYLTGDQATGGDTRGVEPMSISAPLDTWGQLGELPGVYKMDFRQRPGKGGKPTLTLVGFEFVAPAKLPL